MIFAVTRWLLPAHAAIQAVFILGLRFIPSGGWMHSIWQTLAGWCSAGFLLLGLRPERVMTTRESPAVSGPEVARAA